MWSIDNCVLRPFTLCIRLLVSELHAAITSHSAETPCSVRHNATYSVLPLNTVLYFNKQCLQMAKNAKNSFVIRGVSAEVLVLGIFTKTFHLFTAYSDLELSFQS